MSGQDSLKLIARDADDLAIIAAVAQDALVPIGEMAFMPAEQRFAMVLNRFRWDRMNPNSNYPTFGGMPRAAPDRDAPFWEALDQPPPYERILAGLRFEKVTAVGTRGIDLRNRGRILELLTIRSEPPSIVVVFAGDAIIRLEATGLHCIIEDFGDSWPTRHRPIHPESAPAPPTK